MVDGAFQSTRPRGARRSRGVKMDTGLPVSIHAPAWGATAIKTGTCFLKRSFNPRARVGRDSYIYIY